MQVFWDISDVNARGQSLGTIIVLLENSSREN